ncbi:hypothetical protein TRFO_06224 [Tritrichomonas foetus]|uniref:Uncharacterized protein n=1 Tax=Tritrichomonas foetus TaxID=1144522 RepID=A0A1J4K031_9EUKA|nr:hypothetical protein TRFO_06224 [Tritrichomonas foetus]|eukprot:OHT04777.1 hypothetical protein TRFO_06224 [Tritrichomonas foetus]
MKVKYGDRVLSLHKGGNVSLEKEGFTESHSISQNINYNNCNFNPIQFNRYGDRVLLFTNDVEIYEFKTDSVDCLAKIDFPNGIFPDNLFWSQIENDNIIACFPNHICLINSSNGQIINKMEIGDIKKCKTWQNSIILHRFSLISLTGEHNLSIISPFTSHNFILNPIDFQEFQQSLPNINSNYFNACFSDVYPEKSKLAHSQFNSLFGIRISPFIYPLNVNIDSKILDFECRNNEIFAITEKELYRISIPSFPSIFDSQKCINVNVIKLAEISFEKLFSCDSLLFGVNSRLHADTQKVFQLFDKCVISLHQNSNITQILPKRPKRPINITALYNDEFSSLINNNNDNKNLDSQNLILLFKNGTIAEVEDQSIYYDDSLSTKMKQLQDRREELLALRQSVELKARNFRKELAQLRPTSDVKNLLKRLQALKLDTQTQNDDISHASEVIEKIKKDIPELQKGAFNGYMKFSERLDQNARPISVLKSAVERSVKK